MHFLFLFLLENPLRVIGKQCRVGRKPSETEAQLSPRSQPRHLEGKRTAQKDAIKDTPATAM